MMTPTRLPRASSRAASNAASAQPKITAKSRRAARREGAKAIGSNFVNAFDLVHAGDLARVHRLFDRIIVTARSHDIDPDWWRLLTPGGRIVVPLDIGYGGERAIGFVREGDRLHSIGSYACAFVELRGEKDETDPAMFFRTRSARYDREPGANTPLDVVAVERLNADASLLEGADAVVARPHTLFAVTRAF